MPPIIPILIELAYLVGAAMFIFSLHWMGDPKTARRGVYAGVLGMSVAILATWAPSYVSSYARRGSGARDAKKRSTVSSGSMLR